MIVVVIIGEIGGFSVEVIVEYVEVVEEFKFEVIIVFEFWILVNNCFGGGIVL